jgi:nucleoside-diphosphate-sugar epimerase
VEIIGGGFLAGRLAALADRHPHVTVFAAGVSSTGVEDPAAFDREAAMVRSVARRCARQGRTVVYLSTASHALYGPTSTPVGEDAAVAPPLPYGRHKLTMEREVAGSGARWLLPRLSHVVGPGQRPHHLLPAFVRQIRQGTVRLHRGACRDLVAVDDVVRGIDGLLDIGFHGGVVHLASGRPQPVEAIARGIVRRMAATPRYEIVPAPPTATVVSVDKLCRLLPGMRSLTEPDYLDRILDRYVPFY